MKKITTNGRSFGAAQSLTRQQLKNVMGGVTMTTQPHNCAVYLPPGTGTGTVNSPTTWTQWGSSGGGIGFSSMSMNDGTSTFYGVSSADAQAQAVGTGAHWCCSNCSSASWYNPIP